MHHKNIKLLIRKQLKKQYSNWRLLSKKEKKEIARKVLAEVIADYDFKSDITASPSELLTRIFHRFIRNTQFSSFNTVS